MAVNSYYVLCASDNWKLHGSLTVWLRTKHDKNRPTIAQAGAAADMSCCRVWGAMLQRSKRVNMCSLTPAEAERSAGAVMPGSHLIALSGNCSGVWTWSNQSAAIVTARILQLLSAGLLCGLSTHFVAFLFRANLPRFCLLSSSSFISPVYSFSPECCDWLVCSVCSFMSLFLPPAPHFLALRRSIRIISAFICDWNYFAPDKGNLCGNSWNHQHRANVSWEGFKTTARGIIFFL